MYSMTVGGRHLELTKEQVIRAMRDRTPEPIREHVVDIGDISYPPKQVLATLTGWERTTFTTLEAQRVLTKVGFVCRRVGTTRAEKSSLSPSLEARVAALENALGVAHEAIANVKARLDRIDANA